jgi:hypothetical protein
MALDQHPDSITTTLRWSCTAGTSVAPRSKARDSTQPRLSRSRRPGSTAPGDDGAGGSGFLETMEPANPDSAGKVKRPDPADALARCLPRCHLSDKKGSISSQVRFLPGASTASLSGIAEAWRERARRRLLRPRLPPRRCSALPECLRLERVVLGLRDRARVKQVLCCFDLTGWAAAP